MSEHIEHVDETSLANPSSLDNNPRYIVHHDWRSDLLGTSRSIFVYLPEAYASQPESHFQTLLLHDGQNLFDGRLSHIPGVTWQAHTTADNLTRQGLLAPTILVGIANMQTGRLHEYTPDPDPTMRGGGGPEYVRHIVRELLRELREKYRISPCREHLGIAGSSLGALISLYAGLHYPDTFGAVGALSSSLWWNKRSLLNTLRGPLPGLQSRRPRIWLDMGTLEGQIHLRDTASFARALKRLGWRDNVDLKHVSVEGGKHSEADWATRFGDVLQFLFPIKEPHESL